jgi:acyl-coenzyme A thioesterase PaaI-like protein
MLSVLGKLLPTLTLDGDRNVVRDAWNLLAGLPGGKLLFSRMVGRMAPYTGTIGARVTALRPGFAQVELDDRRAVRNHLDCVHAIALCNLAELAGNVGVAYSLPDDARFIVAGLSIEYVKKARGTITATSESPIPGTNAKAEYLVPVVMTDAGGEVVARAQLRTLVGPKSARTERSTVVSRTSRPAARDLN